MDVNGMAQLVIYLLLGAIAVYIVYWIVGMLSLPEQAKTAAALIVAVIVLVWLARTFGLL